MQELTRTYTAAGVAFDVTCQADEFWEHAAPALAALGARPEPEAVRFAVADRGPEWGVARWTVYRHEEPRASTADPRTALDALLVDLDDAVISANVAKGLVVHAGAVERDGRVGVLPAASGSGKTTLTAACVAAGARYLTDEAVVITRDGEHVEPYHRPLCVKPGSRELFAALTGVPVPADLVGTWHVQPELLGELSAGGRPAAVIVPEYTASAGLVLDEISRAQAVLALAGQASFLEQQGREMLDVLAAVVRDSTCVRIRYDDARLAAQAVLELLA